MCFYWDRYGQSLSSWVWCDGEILSPKTPIHITLCFKKISLCKGKLDWISAKKTEWPFCIYLLLLLPYGPCYLDVHVISAEMHLYAKINYAIEDRSIYLPIYLAVCLSLYLSIYLPLCLSFLQLSRLRCSLQEAEESRDAGRKDLIEAHRQLRECASERDVQRKEALELRRALGDTSRERDAIHTSNQDLRVTVKRIENDNNRLGIIGWVESWLAHSEGHSLTGQDI